MCLRTRVYLELGFQDARRRGVRIHSTTHVGECTRRRTARSHTQPAQTCSVKTCSVSALSICPCAPAACSAPWPSSFPPFSAHGQPDRQTQTDPQKDRQTDRRTRHTRTDRQTRHTHTHIDRQTDTDARARTHINTVTVRAGCKRGIACAAAAPRPSCVALVCHILALPLVGVPFAILVVNALLPGVHLYSDLL